jgi:hypothetical protein
LAERALIACSAREAFLADAGFAGEQHRHLRGGGLAQQRGRGLERFRAADHRPEFIGRLQRRAQRVDLALQVFEAHDHRVGRVVARHRLGVRPLAERPGLDQAVAVAAGAALHLLEQRRAAHEGAGVAGCVAEQHPAHRLVLRAEVAHVGLDFPGMVPAEDAVEMARRDVGLELLRRDLHRAFEHVQLRADREHVEQRAVTADLARQRRVALAGGVAGAQQQPTRLLAADGAHQFAAQRAERRRMDQQHALVSEPDAPVAGREMDHAAQVGVGGQRWQRLRGHGELSRYEAALSIPRQPMISR